MGFKFSQIGEQIVEGDFVRGDQTLHVWVDANALTQRKIEKLNEQLADITREKTGMEQQAAQASALGKLLVLVIKRWDAEDAELKEDALADLPIALLSDLLEFCTQLVSPKKKTAAK